MVWVCCSALLPTPRAIWNVFIPGHCTRTMLVMELLCGVGNEMLLEPQSMSMAEPCSPCIQHLQIRLSSCRHVWFVAELGRILIYSRSPKLFLQVFSSFCLIPRPQLKPCQILSQTLWGRTTRVSMSSESSLFFSISGKIPFCNIRIKMAIVFSAYNASHFNTLSKSVGTQWEGIPLTLHFCAYPLLSASEASTHQKVSLFHSLTSTLLQSSRFGTALLSLSHSSHWPIRSRNVIFPRKHTFGYLFSSQIYIVPGQSSYHTIFYNGV